MRGSLRYSQRTTVLLWLSLLSLCGQIDGWVSTEVQSGPLYRVVSTPLTISCHVSGFKHVNVTKIFEFRIGSPGELSSGDQIISTGKASFTYAMYTQRVDSGQITLEHVSPNSVIFKIQELKKDDEGEYECSVVNLEGDYFGQYSAKTTVKVIDNSLSVSSPVSTSMSHYQGDPLSVACQASSNTVQHTHLSVAWYHYEGNPGDAQLIISLDREFTLNPGERFAERYQAGLIRLDKIEEATYLLQMDELELSDQGVIYCEAQEWIQDPDRSWYSIAKRNAGHMSLTVKAKEVAPDESSLAVRISVKDPTLQEGQELSVTCSLDAQNLAEEFITLAWLRENEELARIGPTGVLSVSPQYASREQQGELRAARTTEKDYHLVLHPIITQDQGKYVCRAWPEQRGADGSFSQKAAQESDGQLVSISTTESGFAVGIEDNQVKVNEGKKARLTCRVDGSHGPLSVSWQHRPASTSADIVIQVISLDREGVMEVAQEFRERSVRATRPAADTFTLELDEVTPADSGSYKCVVSEWTTKSNSGIEKIGSRSEIASVTVTPLESVVKAVLINRNTEVVVGENAELLCRLTGSDLPMTVTWSVQREKASSPDNILTSYANGDISWSGVQQRYQLQREIRGGLLFLTLLINGVSHREAGRYQCEASVFLEQRHKRLPPSNLLTVMVKDPVGNLKLNKSSVLLSTMEGEDAMLECNLISWTASYMYTISWLYTGSTGVKVPLVQVDRHGLLKYTTNRELRGMHTRLQLSRPTSTRFHLRIQRAHKGDSGMYECQVEQYQVDHQGNWQLLVTDGSGPIRLSVNVTVGDLRLNKSDLQLSTMEGEDMTLECNLISGTVKPSFMYTVSWLYNGSDPRVSAVPLVYLDRQGLLRYPQSRELGDLQARLRLSRPAHTSFRLSIQRAHEGDSGTYACQVEQYQLDLHGDWQLLASDVSGPIRLSVNVTEHNLSIVKEDVVLNLTSPNDVTVPCVISAQSSNSSQFQVSWFCQAEDDSDRRTVFVSYRNSTLENRFKESDRIRFARPNSKTFSLTVMRPIPDDSGQYSCEVQEWVPSPSNGWRRVAVETSGYRTVIINTEAGTLKTVSEPGCNSGTLLGALVGVTVCLLSVVLVLAFTLCRAKGFGKKTSQSLWTERVQLNTTPTARE